MPSKTAPKKKLSKPTSLSKRPKKKTKKITTWRQAKRMTLRRRSVFGTIEELDKGVNYFVLMLEKLGAETEFSCEGHPSGFYIVFSAPIFLASKILGCGFFRVELEGSFNGRIRWSIRGQTMNTEQEKERYLNWAAESWAKAFGDIEIEHNVNKM